MKTNLARKFARKPISFDGIWKLFGQQATQDEIRQTASRICRDYLTGRWKDVSADKLNIKRISGGLSNYLYYVSLPRNDELENTVVTTTSENTARNQRDQIEFTSESRLNNTELSKQTFLNNDYKRKRNDSGSYFLATNHKLDEPREVLLRIYGQSHGEDALEAMITESVVFALLSERNLGPKLLGIFPGGRIEQYIPARPLSTSELSHRFISLRIAEKMGEIHSLNIPMSKEPDWLWSCLQRWQLQLSAILATNNRHEQFLKEFNFVEETVWLKSIIDLGQYPVFFCHNDLQEGNILLRQYTSNDTLTQPSLMNCLSTTFDDGVLDDTKKINHGKSDVTKIKYSKINNKLNSYIYGEMVHQISNSERNENYITAENSEVVMKTEPDLIIIDFEYCAYNYRGFDLANHFLEWTFDYSNREYPFFYHYKLQYPSKEQRQQFIRVYLEKLQALEAIYRYTDDDMEKVEHEIQLFTLLSHLFWSLWSIVNTASNIEFGYWDYAIIRIKEYQKLKDEFMSAGNVHSY